MDNVDINLFKFDYDLTMAMFFMNAQSFIYSRYGIRKDGDGTAMQSLEGVKDAMRKVLDIHKREAARGASPWKPFDTQDLVSFQKDPRRPNGCLHCHHAGYYMRKEEFSVGRITKETVWGYPLPQNIGIEPDIDRNTIVKDARDPAARAGVQTGDRVVSIDGQRVVTPADITWALHAFKGGTLKVVVERGGKNVTASMELKGADWRKTDVTWRESWWDSGPDIGLKSAELTSDERKPLGLSGDQLALRVTSVDGNGSAASSGVRADDVIVSVDGKSHDMEAIELQMWIRLTKRSRETTQLGVVRGSQRQTIAVKLK